MLCSDYQELISAQLDKELTPAEEQALSAHLKECTVCSDFAKKIAELKNLATSWENEPMPKALERQILARTTHIGIEKLPVFNFMAGHYKVPKGLAWATVVLFFVLLFNTFLGPLTARHGPDEARPTMTEKTGVQKILLTERDVVQVHTMVLKNNNF